MVTKVQLAHPTPDISKVLQSGVEKLTTTIQNTKNEEVKALRDLPWQITPSKEVDRRLKHYLMLSKIRLTCENHQFNYN